MKKFTFLASALLALGGLTAQAADIYICGPFNNYNPNGDEQWGLQLEDADNGSYIGYFEIPEGQFQINFKYSMFKLLPGVQVDDMVEATPGNVTVFDEDPYFEGKFAMDFGDTYWVDPNWEGGMVQIMIDFDSEDIYFLPDSNGPDVWYLRGAFNDYDPDGDFGYALQPDEDNPMVYSGEFFIPEGEFSFNLLSPQGVVFVPYNSEDDEYENVVVGFTNNEYVGFIEYAETNADKAYYWTYPGWQGGMIRATLDPNERSFTLINLSEPTEELIIYLSGPFNDFNPDGDLSYALFPDPDDETTYIGYIDIPAGQFKVNFQYAFGNLLPGVYNDDWQVEPSAEDVTVFDDDTFFYGPFVSSTLNNVYWVNENWEGGTVEVMVDLFYESVIFSIDEPVEDVYYVRGAFNDYDPAGRPEYALVQENPEAFVYTGEIEIPAGQFSFNILGLYGTIFVPFNMETWEGETVVVEFTDNTYVGETDSAWAEGEEFCYWTYPEWQGGKVSISIDIFEGTVTIENLSEGSGVDMIGAEGNEVIYNLQGIRVDRSKLQKGIYIVNGKKVIL